MTNALKNKKQSERIEEAECMCMGGRYLRYAPIMKRELISDLYLNKYFVDLFICKIFVFGHLERNLCKVTIFYINFPQTNFRSALFI